MTMLPLMTALLLLAGGDRQQADTAQFELKLRAAEKTVLVGQPTKVSVLLTASADMPVDPGAVRLMISDGSTFREYRSPEPGGTPAWIFPPHIGRGVSFEVEKTIDIVRNVDALGNGQHVFAMGTPGKYLLKARYDVGSGDRRIVRESNVVAIATRLPTGRDRDLFDKELRSHPQLISQWAATERDTKAAVRRLIEEYEDSPYLSAAQLGVWREDLDRVIAPTLDRTQAAVDAKATARALLQAVAAKALAGPFEEDRLLLVAERWVMLQDRAEAKRVYELVQERFPASAGSRKAEEWIKSEMESQATEQRIPQIEDKP